MVARRAHNPKVVGSNPAPATKFVETKKASCHALEAFFVSTNLRARMEPNHGSPIRLERIGGARSAVPPQAGPSTGMREPNPAPAIKFMEIKWP